MDRPGVIAICVPHARKGTGNQMENGHIWKQDCVSQKAYKINGVKKQNLTFIKEVNVIVLDTSSPGSLVSENSA